jgi:hypothetical protein
MKSKSINYFIIGTFVSLYLIVSVISTIHVIDFFRLSNPEWLAVSLAIAFEIGAAASLASLIALKKMNRSLVWTLFFVLTAMQMMGNTYYAFTNLDNFQDWVDLFGLTEEEPIFQKRILSLISGAVLPLVALGFIKSLVDYIKPSDEEPVAKIEEPTLSDEEILKRAEKIKIKNVWEAAKDYRRANPLTEDDLADEPTALANSQYRLEEDVEEEPIEEEFVEVDDSEEPSEEMYTEEDKQAVIEAIQAETDNPELTREDIEIYKEKSRIPPRGREKIIKADDSNNPHIIPGVRT